MDDDSDDRALYVTIFNDLQVKNPVKLFDSSTEAFIYLCSCREQPFLILCDINLPFPDGLELRRRINDSEYLREKSIPFVFLSTSDNKDTVREAYALISQGYFVKQPDYQQMLENMRLIYGYWSVSRHPNNSYF
ncbi:CheY-like response regulator receiver domain protein [Filimonas lacunae]|nr:CheY-like response regulator receiver domain protein [Filimonas lacunae]